MKTLEVCSYYTDSRLYKNLFNALEDLGEGLDVFYFTDNKRDISSLDKDLVISNSYKKWERLFFFLKHKKVYEDAKNLLDLNSYSHSHAHSLMSNGYISYKLKKDFGLKYITAVRRTDLFFFMKYKPYLKGLGADILDNAEKIIFLSPVFLEKTVEIFGPKIGEENIRGKSLIIPNGIEPVYFDNLAEPKEMGDRINLVFIGKTLDPNKNVKNIIKTAEMLKIRGEDVQLKLIGDVDENFKEKIKDKPYIKATGRLSPEEIIKELKEDHIFIMPSYTETFGLVYVEAMSQGLGVIYTRGQGFDGQFEEGEVGYGVDPDSVDEMLEAVDRIRANYKKISANAIEGSKRYNWPDIAKKYQEIYKELEK